MKLLTVLLATILSFFVAACAPTANSRSTGQALDDSALTVRVKTEIAQSQGIGDAAKINVDTYRGVVSLAGFVNTDQEKRNAGQAAMRVSGVEKVFNNLQLKPPATSSGQ